MATFSELRARIGKDPNIWDELVDDYYLYHGARIKDVEKVLKEGLCTFKTPSEAHSHIDQALAFFNKTENYLVSGLKQEIAESERRVVWVTPIFEDACNWATRNPEIIWLALLYSDVSQDKAVEYLEKTYGPRYKLTLNIKPRLRHIYALATAIPLKECLSPEDIKKIEPCDIHTGGHVHYG